MKNFKRILAVCLVLILAVGAFTGCRKKKADGNAVPDAAETAQPVSDGKEPVGGEVPVNTGTDKPEPAAQETGKYEVLVSDMEGNPVPGVMIQFCSDTECVLGQTGEDGIALFEKEAGEYTVHVLKAPEGYDADDTEYSATSEPGILTIELRAQAWDETVDDTKPHTIFDPNATWKTKTLINFTAKELLVPVFKSGECVYDCPSIQEIQVYCADQLDCLWDEVKRFENPHNYYVDLSEQLYQIKSILLSLHKM